MARVPQINYETAPPETRALWDDVAQHHSISNMKATALHSPAATHAILEWYALFDEVTPFLGERLAVLFCHAISRENACKLCWTFMRKEIIDGGEDPERVDLDDREMAVVEFGRQLAADPNAVSDEVWRTLEGYFTSAQLVDLVTFGALMVVNNIFNSVLEVALDDQLDGYGINPEQLRV